MVHEFQAKLASLGYAVLKGSYGFWRINWNLSQGDFWTMSPENGINSEPNLNFIFGSGRRICPDLQLAKKMVIHRSFAPASIWLETTGKLRELWEFLTKTSELCYSSTFVDNFTLNSITFIHFKNNHRPDFDNTKVVNMGCTNSLIEETILTSTTTFGLVRFGW